MNIGEDPEEPTRIEVIPTREPVTAPREPSPAVEPDYAPDPRRERKPEKVPAGV